MLRATFSFGVAAVTIGGPIEAQQPPPDTVRAIAALHWTLVGVGSTIGPRIWPGFRPDTIATHYVIPRRAKLLAQWRDTLPTGFSALTGVQNAAWTDTRTVSFPRGRPIAFLSVDSAASPGSVLGLALHEQFHAFQRAVARRGRRFGAGENAMLVATYPSFDAENEASFALEGELLARALRARTPGEAKRIAREFLAVREARHARLDSAHVEFETLSELHEGLAQYALLRGLRELASVDPKRFTAAADAETTIETALLDSLLAVGPRSVRRRFYATGSAMARLLDWIADRQWKERLVREDAALSGMLAAAADYRGRDALERPATERIAARLARLRGDADHAVAALGARRRAQRDSALAGSGVLLVVDPAGLPERRLNWCFFDPQNVLMVSASELLHTRVLRVCAGSSVEIQFDQAVVENRDTGELRSLIGAGSPALRLTAGGVPFSPPPDGRPVVVTDLRIEGPRISLAAPLAAVSRQGDRVRVTLQSAP